jgi:hypothetical protein
MAQVGGRCSTKRASQRGRENKNLTIYDGLSRKGQDDTLVSSWFRCIKCETPLEEGKNFRSNNYRGLLICNSCLFKGEKAERDKFVAQARSKLIASVNFQDELERKLSVARFQVALEKKLSRKCE